MARIVSFPAPPGYQSGREAPGMFGVKTTCALSGADFLDHLCSHILAIQGLLNHDEQALATAISFPQLANGPLLAVSAPSAICAPLYSTTSSFPSSIRATKSG